MNTTCAQVKGTDVTGTEDYLFGVIIRFHGKQTKFTLRRYKSQTKTGFDVISS